VYCVAYSPDGKTLASGGGWEGDRTIKLWNVQRGKEQATLDGHTDGVRCVAFSPDGKTLASGGYDYTIKLWDVQTGKKLTTLKGHTGWVTSVAYSPDGKTLASVGGERSEETSARADRTVKLWDVQTGKEADK
jgi:WD40 repeat protein